MKKQRAKIPLRVLIVEDSEQDGSLLVKELERGGYEVTSLRVATSKAMKKALDDRQWDIVIGDCAVPDLGGADALAILNKQGLDIPFIIVSESSGEDSAVSMLKAGAVDYLLKEHLKRLVPSVRRELLEAANRREHKSSAEALQQSEARFRALATAAACAIFIYQGEKFRYVNRATELLTGYSEAELFSMRFWDVVHPDFREKVKQQGLSRQRGETVPERYEFKIVTKKGQERWLDFTATRILYEGAPAALGTAFDITDRKRLDEVLERTVSSLTSTLEATADGLLLVDAQGKILTFNKKFIEMWNIPEDVLASRDDKKALDFVLSQLKDPEGFLTKVNELYAHPDEESFDTIEFKDGKICERFSKPQRIMGKSVGRVWSFRDVTERKRAEEAVRTSEAELRALFAAMTDVILILDSDGRYLKIAPTNPALLYRPPNEILGRTMHEIFPKDQADFFLGHVKQALETNLPVNLEYSLPINGVEMWFAGTVSRISNNTVILVARDITEQKRAGKLERAVYQVSQAADTASNLEDLYRSIHEIVKQVMLADNFYIALYDEKQNLVSFPYFVDEVDLPGHPQKPGKGLTEYVLRSGRSLLCGAEHFEQLQRRGDVELVGASSPIWLGVPLTVENKTIGVMVVQDYSNPTTYTEREQHILEYVSSQVARAIDRKRSEELLRQSEERYRTFVDSARDVIYLLSRDGILQSLNPAFDHVTGWSREEWIGKSFTALIHPDDLSLAVKTIHRAVRGEHVLTYELRIRSKAGSYIVGEFTQTPQLQNGTVVGVLGIVRDVTERKRFEEQMRQAQKLEGLGALAGGIAHDFNNLLGIILGHARLLEVVKENPQKFSESIEVISKAVQRGTAVVRQILTFARQSTAIVEPVNLNSIAEELTKLLSETLPKTVTIDLNLDRNVPNILGDRTQIHQVLLNLCVNARDAMASGGTLAISSRVVSDKEVREQFVEAQDGEYVCIDVEDNGVGMDEVTKGRIFEPFFTTKEFGKGTGLGLAVVYGVIKSHQGFISVESEPQRGTKFHLYFPVPSQRAETMEVQHPEQTSVVGGSETILIVEDEEMLRSLIGTLLEGLGYKVIGAADGVEAVELYKAHQSEIALVLTDMGLPRMGGWEAFQHMKKINPGVKAIFASGYLDPQLKADMLQAGAKEFVQKPYKPDQLFKMIREVIAGTFKA